MKSRLGRSTAPQSMASLRFVIPLLSLAVVYPSASAIAQDTDEGDRILARLEYERIRTYSGSGVSVSARMRAVRERAMGLRRIA